MSVKCLLVGLLICVAASSKGDRYKNAGFDDEAAVDAFMARFQRAVVAGDAKQAARMTRFPIKVFVGGKRVPVDAATFERDWARIMRPDFVERVRNAEASEMFSRDQGVMLGDGEVWLAPVDEKPAVVAINNEPPRRSKKE